MKSFLIKLSVFILLNLIPYFVLAELPLLHRFTNSSTESNLLIIPKNTAYDFLMMGTSHGRIFSRGGNHDRVEHMLGKTFLNISQGGGHGGIFGEQEYLKWFYARGNTAPRIVYFIDPWLLYSRRWNEGNYFLEGEPLDVEFLAQVYHDGIDQDVIVNYLKSKVYPSWVTLVPETGTTGVSDTVAYDPNAAKERIASLYLDGENPHTFTQYEGELKKMLDLAKTHGTKVIFITPASLLGKLDGQDALNGYLRSLQGSYDIEVYDDSTVIADTKYFYDHDHLNEAGVELFTQKYLKPLLD